MRLIPDVAVVGKDLFEGYLGFRRLLGVAQGDQRRVRVLRQGSRFRFLAELTMLAYLVAKKYRTASRLTPARTKPRLYATEKRNAPQEISTCSLATLGIFCASDALLGVIDRERHRALVGRFVGSWHGR